MNVVSALNRKPAQVCSGDRDRDLIRVDVADDKLGIAAALRQAFCVAAHEPCEIDFDRLLSELN